MTDKPEGQVSTSALAVLNETDEIAVAFDMPSGLLRLQPRTRVGRLWKKTSRWMRGYRNRVTDDGWAVQTIRGPSLFAPFRKPRVVVQVTLFEQPERRVKGFRRRLGLRLRRLAGR